jgi:predicted lipid-binding transport protein (Tim44 family)
LLKSYCGLAVPLSGPLEGVIEGAGSVGAGSAGGISGAGSTIGAGSAAGAGFIGAFFFGLAFFFVIRFAFFFAPFLAFRFFAKQSHRSLCRSSKGKKPSSDSTFPTPNPRQRNLLN